MASIIAIVGLKSDLRTKSPWKVAIPREQGERFVTERMPLILASCPALDTSSVEILPYFEVSALTGEGVMEFFDQLSVAWFRHRELKARQGQIIEALKSSASSKPNQKKKIELLEEERKENVVRQFHQAIEQRLISSILQCIDGNLLLLITQHPETKLNAIDYAIRLGHWDIVYQLLIPALTWNLYQRQQLISLISQQDVKSKLVIDYLHKHTILSDVVAYVCSHTSLHCSLYQFQNSVPQLIDSVLTNASPNVTKSME